MGEILEKLVVYGEGGVVRGGHKIFIIGLTR
jgi:hypothetical protein